MFVASLHSLRGKTQPCDELYLSTFPQKNSLSLYIWEQKHLPISFITMISKGQVIH